MNPEDTAYYSPENRLYHNLLESMGTRLDLVISGVSLERAGLAFTSIAGLLSNIEGRLSHYDPGSELSRLNRLATERETVAGEELFRIIQDCREYCNRTSGLFDISLGKASDLVKLSDATQETVMEMLGRTGMDRIETDPQRRSVRFTSDCVSLDLGAYGKGYALDRVMSLLKSMEISDAFISFGESSIFALGRHPHGEGWKSGISHQLKPEESLFEFVLKDEALSTSGNSPNNAIYGKGHILHPARGIVDRGIGHVSVASGSAARAEVLSTALFAADVEEKRLLLKNFPDCRVLEAGYAEDGTAGIRTYNFETRQDDQKT